MGRIAAGILAAALVLAGGVHADEKPAGRVAAPVVKIERGGACVAPVGEMRRNHMQLLKHQRDRTVHQGERKTRFALKDCIECHAGRETGSVLGKDGFCASCHAYASVSMDCFECHSPKRQGGAVSVRQ
jgi:hypothetical protein